MKYTLKNFLIDEICKEIKPFNKDKFKKDLRKLTEKSLLDLNSLTIK
jgi:hypothetical protein